jgi:hypothetical protein
MASQDQHSGGAYRQYLPDLSIPRFTTMQKQDAHEYAAAFKESGAPPWLHGLYLHWQNLYQEPFKGVTNDGLSAHPLTPFLSPTHPHTH